MPDDVKPTNSNDGGGNNSEALDKDTYTKEDVQTLITKATQEANERAEALKAEKEKAFNDGKAALGRELSDKEEEAKNKLEREKLESEGKWKELLSLKENELTEKTGLLDQAISELEKTNGIVQKMNDSIKTENTKTLASLEAKMDKDAFASLGQILEGKNVNEVKDYLALQSKILGVSTNTPQPGKVDTKDGKSFKERLQELKAEKK